jgi:hypothetical protein
MAASLPNWDEDTPPPKPLPPLTARQLNEAIESARITGDGNFIDSKIEMWGKVEYPLISTAGLNEPARQWLEQRLTRTSLYVVYDRDAEYPRVHGPDEFKTFIWQQTESERHRPQSSPSKLKEEPKLPVANHDGKRTRGRDPA